MERLILSDREELERMKADLKEAETELEKNNIEFFEFLQLSFQFLFLLILLFLIVNPADR